VRIDGLDNIEIPSSVTMTPSVEENFTFESFREKVASYLVGIGFSEIMTNSITNHVYFDETELRESVKMLNSLSAELNIMRPHMLETGLESVAYNLNRKNIDLKFFDFGKTYSSSGPRQYDEAEHLCLYITGDIQESGWRNTAKKTDLYFLKGILNAVLSVLGITANGFEPSTHRKLSPCVRIGAGGKIVGQFGAVQNFVLRRFDIKQPVFFADFDWQALMTQAEGTEIKIEEIAKFPVVYRDLAVVVPLQTKYAEAESAIQKLKLKYLQNVRLFDVFESDKLGKEKKSMAMSLTFLNKEKTLTDAEVDEMMKQIMKVLEKEVQAEVRK